MAYKSKQGFAVKSFGIKCSRKVIRKRIARSQDKIVRYQQHGIRAADCVHDANGHCAHQVDCFGHHWAKVTENNFFTVSSPPIFKLMNFSFHDMKKKKIGFLSISINQKW